MTSSVRDAAPSSPADNAPNAFSDENEVPSNKNSKFYLNAKNYWSNVVPTVDGMLGGFGSISVIDVHASKRFLNDIFKAKDAPERRYALDCGGGIGRVTKFLLCPTFEKVDIVEQDPKFAEQAHVFVNDGRLVEVFNVGLQDFTPTTAKYNIIWSQWVLGHLTDEHLKDFFKRSAAGLTKNGIFIIKENFTSILTSEITVDQTDSSVTRPLPLMKELIRESGWKIIKLERQIDFPKGLFPVYMIAMKPTMKQKIR